MTKLLLMFLEFFKTGLFAVGGGLATIPFLREIGVRYGWYTMSDLSTMIAVNLHQVQWVSIWLAM